jgi:hypothetical protein
MNIEGGRGHPPAAVRHGANFRMRLTLLVFNATAGFWLPIIPV